MSFMVHLMKSEVLEFLIFVVLYKAKEMFGFALKWVFVPRFFAWS